MLCQWEAPQASSYKKLDLCDVAPPPFLIDSLLIDTTKLIVILLISISDLESAISPQSPSSFLGIMLLTCHNLDIMDVSCHWFVIASSILEWTEVGIMQLSYLSCMTTFQNNQKKPWLMKHVFPFENCKLLNV